MLQQIAEYYYGKMGKNCAEAVLLAAEYYAEIRFDETAQTAQGFITVNLQRNKAEILDRQGNMC